MNDENNILKCYLKGCVLMSKFICEISILVCGSSVDPEGLFLSVLIPQVVILYFEPSTFRCILLRWVRLLGFATVYGTVTLKLHRYIVFH